MVTHYTLQTKDHKISIKEEDLTLSDFLYIRNALKNYQNDLEWLYKREAEKDALPDVIESTKTLLEDIVKLRKKIDGIE